MKNTPKLLLLYCMLVFCCLCTACYTVKQYDIEHKIVQEPEKSEPQYIDISIIEGKTTKQEIMNILGMPDDINTDSLTYDVYKHNIKVRIHLVQQDGTTINTIIGDNEKYKYMSIYCKTIYRNNTAIITPVVHYVSIH